MTNYSKTNEKCFCAIINEISIMAAPKKLQSLLHTCSASMRASIAHPVFTTWDLLLSKFEYT